MNVMMYIYQSVEAAQQLFSFSGGSDRTTQIFTKLFQSLAGGSSYKVKQTKFVQNGLFTKSMYRVTHLVVLQMC